LIVSELSIHSVQFVQPTQQPIADLIKFSKKYDPAKVAKEELCSKHGLRKTLLCSTCRVFICDKCLITIQNDHFNHAIQPLSKLAFDVYNAFRVNFDRLSHNMQNLRRTDPSDWKIKLRR